MIRSLDAIDVIITGAETDEGIAARLRQLGKTVERVQRLLFAACKAETVDKASALRYNKKKLCTHKQSAHLRREGFPTKPIVIGWIGCHEEGLPAFRRILAGGKCVARFVTLSDAAFGKRSAGSRAYLALCEAYDVPVSLVDTIKGDEAYALLAAEPIDLLVVLGWSEILPSRVLALPRIGTVGTHASLLPHNRGSAPVNWAILRGETQGGNSMMWLNERVDEGQIIGQMPFAITAFDTCKTVYDKVADTNEAMLWQLIETLEAGDMPAQRADNRTDEPLLPRRRPADGLMRWDLPAKQVYDFVRALTRPYPGAFTTLEGKKYLVWRASLLPGERREAEPGTILGPVYSPEPACCGIAAACAAGSVVLHELEGEEGVVYAGPALPEAGFAGRFE